MVGIWRKKVLWVKGWGERKWGYSINLVVAFAIISMEGKRVSVCVCEVKSIKLYCAISAFRTSLSLFNFSSVKDFHVTPSLLNLTNPWFGFMLQSIIFLSFQQLYISTKQLHSCFSVTLG